MIVLLSIRKCACHVSNHFNCIFAEFSLSQYRAIQHCVFHIYVRLSIVRLMTHQIQQDVVVILTDLCVKNSGDPNHAYNMYSTGQRMGLQMKLVCRLGYRVAIISSSSSTERIHCKAYVVY